MKKISNCCGVYPNQPADANGDHGYCPKCGMGCVWEDEPVYDRPKGHRILNGFTMALVLVIAYFAVFYEIRTAWYFLVGMVIPMLVNIGIFFQRFMYLPALYDAYPSAEAYDADNLPLPLDVLFYGATIAMVVYANAPFMTVIWMVMAAGDFLQRYLVKSHYKELADEQGV